MTMDKPRMSRMASASSMANMERTERTGVYERLAPTVRSFTGTLIAWTSAIGFAAMIGLGALSGCASDRGDGEAHSGSDESGTEHGGAENLEIESDDGEESGLSLALDETYESSVKAPGSSCVTTPKAMRLWEQCRIPRKACCLGSESKSTFRTVRNLVPRRRSISHQAKPPRSHWPLRKNRSPDGRLMPR